MKQITISKAEAHRLGKLCNRDEAGEHFYHTHSMRDLARWERAGLIKIDRPIHDPTGVAYSEEYHRVEVRALDWWDAWGELHVDLFPLRWEADTEYWITEVV